MIRIVGGQAKGRMLKVPPGDKTRPTSARVREAVFGMLQAAVPGADVLDLFCGSGAYALEALSRGARRAVLVDSDARAVSCARQNAQSLDFSDKTSIFRSDYLRALQMLRQNGKKFDMIFLDPPYRANLYTKALSGAGPLMREGGWAVCEHAAQYSVQPTQGWALERTKVYGTRAVTLYQKEGPR